MEDILVFLILLMYIGSAVYFCAITGKLFQVRKLKLPILFFISPSVAVVAALFSHNVQISFDTVLKTTIAGVAVETGIQLALELIFMGLYVRLVQAKNRSIAVFIYLCSAMLVPGVMVLYEAVQEKTGLIPVIAYIGLHIFFYKMIVIPLSELTKEKQVTDMKLFLVMPVLTYVFHTVMYIMFLFTLNMIDYSALDVSGIGDFLRSDPKGEKVIDLLHLWRDIIYTQTAAFVYPSIFTLLVLTIAVSIIVKNIRYMNESRKAHEEVKALNIEVMEALAHTIDAKDEYTRGHSVRVAKYSRMIAEKMKLSAEECENVYYMGLLHDIGKIGVPNEIMRKNVKMSIIWAFCMISERSVCRMRSLINPVH